jgi:hypothetical protein
VTAIGPEATETKAAQEMFFELAPSEEVYTVHRPSFADIIVPVSLERELDFFWSMVAPLRLLTQPAVLWLILLYGCALSPQIILMYVAPPPPPPFPTRPGPVRY